VNTGPGRQVAGKLPLLTVNIGNPSPARAERQLRWLARHDAPILVLTETKASAGCGMLREAFTAAGYMIAGDQPPPGGYGTMIVSRLPAQPDPWARTITCLPERVASLILPIPAGPVRVTGVYVPSRDASPEKTERKRQFLDCLGHALAEIAGEMPLILLGDLNILEPGHRPHYSFFRPFEYDFYTRLRQVGLVDAFRLLHPHADAYSWVGKTGDGYRYDHAFVSAALVSQVADCSYHDGCRTGENAFTDHSGLAVHLTCPAPRPLLVSEPVPPRATAQEALF
jgi:exodeoxyribonuclease-3